MKEKVSLSSQQTLQLGSALPKMGFGSLEVPFNNGLGVIYAEPLQLNAI